MTVNKLRLAIMILILTFTGCREKDELTLPVKVTLKIGIIHDMSHQDYLGFGDCRIGIQKIQFEGKREAGQDICFETDPKLNLKTLSFGEEPATISAFDIPQGVYTYMRWDIGVKCIEQDIPYDNRNENKPCIGITIAGNYESMRCEGRIPFILVIDLPEEFTVMSGDTTWNSHIVISADKEYEITIHFDPEKAFSSVDRTAFEDAEVSSNLGYPAIIISSLHNIYLYEILVNRIFLSTDVSVK